MAKTAVVHAQQRWEYLALTRRTDSYLADELNRLGQDGWELVTIIYAKDAKGELFWNAFLKRPATQPAGATPTTKQATEPQPQAAPETPEAEGADTGEVFDLSGDEFEIKEE